MNCAYLFDVTLRYASEIMKRQIYDNVSRHVQLFSKFNYLIAVISFFYRNKVKCVSEKLTKKLLFEEVF